MRKRIKPSLQNKEEIIATVPFDVFGLSGDAYHDLLKNEGVLTRGTAYIGASPADRNQPFPCFKKSQWDSQPIIKIIQSTVVLHSL